MPLYLVLNHIWCAACYSPLADDASAPDRTPDMGESLKHSRIPVSIGAWERVGASQSQPMLDLASITGFLAEVGFEFGSEC